MTCALEMTISPVLLQEWALVVCNSLLKSAVDDYDYRKLYNVVALQGRVSNFVKQWAQRSVSLSIEEKKFKC